MDDHTPLIPCSLTMTQRRNIFMAAYHSKSRASQEYDVIVYMDADILILGNILSILEKTPPAGM